MRVTLDTNVIISGVQYRGNERRMLELADKGRFELVLSPFILDEVQRVLARKFHRDEHGIANDITDLLRIATIIDPVPQAAAVPGGHADKPHPRLRGGGRGGLPHHGRPPSPSAAGGVPRHSNFERRRVS